MASLHYPKPQAILPQFDPGRRRQIFATRRRQLDGSAKMNAVHECDAQLSFALR